MATEAEVIETKRRLREYAATVKHGGGPHQQPLASDIVTLCDAHDKMAEYLNQDVPSMSNELAETKSRLFNLTNNISELMDQRDACRRELAAVKALGPATSAGDNLAEIRKMASAGEPLIDINIARDAKGYPVDGS